MTLPAGAYDTAEVEGLLGVPLAELYAGDASALRVLAANGAPLDGRAPQSPPSSLPFCCHALPHTHPSLQPASRRASCPAGSFELRTRALHVYGEQRRVPGFRDVCNSAGGAEEKMAALGALMDASHASCSGLFECSSPELEALVKVRLFAAECALDQPDSERASELVSVCRTSAAMPLCPPACSPLATPRPPLPPMSPLTPPHRSTRRRAPSGRA